MPAAISSPTMVTTRARSKRIWDIVIFRTRRAIRRCAWSAAERHGARRPSDDDDAGPLCLLRHLGQHQTIALVRLSGRQDLEEMAVASGSSASAPLGSTE